MTEKLKPIGDRLVVLPIEEESTTKSGLMLPDTAKEKPQWGRATVIRKGNASRLM